jgi:hypothetical protein
MRVSKFSFFLTEIYKVSIILIKRYSLYGKIMAVYCENHTELTDTLCVKVHSVLMLKQAVRNVASVP